MPKIRMTQTIAGCSDGIHPRQFIKNQEYEIDNNEISQKLALIFIGCGAAIKIKTRKPILEAPEKAVVDKAPEIKPVMSASEMRKMNPEEPEVEGKEEIPDEDEINKPESKDTRVYQLSDELGVSWKEIVKIADKLKINVTKAQSGLTNTEVEEIKMAFKK